MRSVLEIDVRLESDRFDLAVAWSTDESALGIFGPSGAGKTTLLEAIAGLRCDVTGRIAVRGHTWLDTANGFRLPPEKRGVGYVPQDARLFPHRDVMGNILTGRRRAERAGSSRLDPKRVLEVLELSDLSTVDVGALSGGERQRVALARALCSGPELLLLDEPLAGLDAPLRRRILPYLVRVQREFAIPTIHVSLDATEIKMLCRDALVVAQGRVRGHGAPESLFADPAILPMASEEGLENVLRGTVIGSEGGATTIELAQGPRLVVSGGGGARAAAGAGIGGEALIAVRADDLMVAVDRPTGLSAQNILSGTIREIRMTDAAPDQVVLVFVTIGSSREPVIAAITTQSCRRLQLAAGQSIFLIVKAQSCRILASR
jgi:molybdate transport system ATP-binding protein